MAANFKTNFATGISSAGLPVLPGSVTSGIPVTTGSVFFVDSNTGGGKGTKAQPFSTLDEAVNNCTANKGDVIILMPGHAETLAAADAVDIDVAGVTVVGLGTGGLIPTFTIEITLAFVIGADDVTVRNVHFKAGAAGVAVGLDVNADDFWLDGCLITNDTSSDDFVDFIHVGAASGVADGLKVTGCTCLSADTNNDGFINFAGDCDRFVFAGNYIKLGVATTEPVIEATGKSLTDCLIVHNYISRLNTSGNMFIDTDQTDNTGIVAYNVIASGDVTGAAPIDLTGARLFENYHVGEPDVSGKLAPIVDSAL